jgi:hypothetical protein
MTMASALDNFLVELKATTGPWRLLRSGQIRTDTDPQLCPVCAVANETPWSTAWWEVADRVGLGHKLAHEVAAAADNCTVHDPFLRAQLLEAVGLSEAQS